MAPNSAKNTPVYCVLSKPGAVVSIKTKRFRGVTVTSDDFAAEVDSYDVDHQFYHSAKQGGKTTYQILKKTGFLRTKINLRYILCDNAPNNVHGQSADLAFALAYLFLFFEKDTEVPCPPIVATGQLNDNGKVEWIDDLDVKLEHALNVLPDGGWFIYPDTEKDGKPCEPSEEFKEEFKEELKRIRLFKVKHVIDVFNELGKEHLKLELFQGNPFQSLSSFQPQHYDLFFGRDTDIHSLETQLKKTNKALVFGNSGSGKSSLCRAGIIGKAIKFKPDSTRYAIVTWEDIIQDGKDIFFKAWQTPHGLGADFCSDNNTPVIQKLKAYSDKFQLILLFDQLEQVFSPDARKHLPWLNEFYEYLSRLSKFVWIMATMRSSFFPAYLDENELHKIFKGHSYELSSPDLHVLKAVIYGPTQMQRLTPLKYEVIDGNQDLGTEILKHAGNDLKNVLPLLEYTLDRLYQHDGKSGQLTFKTYRQTIGELQGSISKVAGEAYEALSTSEKCVFSKVFTKLICTIQTKTQAQNIAAMSVFIDDFKNDELKVVNKFVNNKILVNDKGLIRIVHESVFLHWPLMEELINDEKANLLLRDSLTIQAREFQKDIKQGKEPSPISGEKLNRSIELRELWQLDKNILDFIDYSFSIHKKHQQEQRQHREAVKAQELKEKKALVAHAKSEEEKAKIATEKRIVIENNIKLKNKSIKQKNIVIKIVSVLTIITLLLFLYSNDINRQLNDNITQKNQAFGEAKNNLGKLYAEKAKVAFKQKKRREYLINSLLALQNLHPDNSALISELSGYIKSKEPIPIAKLKLPTFQTSHPSSPAIKAALFDEGKKAILIGKQQNIFFYDIPMGKLIKTLGIKGEGFSVSPDNKLAYIFKGSNVFQININNEFSLKEIDGINRKEIIKSISASPDGTVLAITYFDNSAYLYHLNKNDFRELDTQKICKPLMQVNFDRNGNLIVVDRKQVVVLNSESLQQLNTIKGAFRGLVENNKAVVVETPTATIKKVFLEKSNEVKSSETLIKINPKLISKSFRSSHHGNIKYVTAVGSNILLWNEKFDELPVSLNASNKFIDSVDISSDGKTFLSVSKLGDIIIWDSSKETKIQFDRQLWTDPKFYLSFRKSKQNIAYNSAVTRAESKIQLSDGDSGKIITNWPIKNLNFTDIAFSPENKKIIGLDVDNKLHIFDIESGMVEIKTLKANLYKNDKILFRQLQYDSYRSVFLSQDGSYVGYIDPYWNLLNIETGKKISTKKQINFSNYSKAFLLSDLTNMLLIDNERKVKYINVRSGEDFPLNEGRPYLTAPTEAKYCKKKNLLAVSFPRFIELWDLNSYKKSFINRSAFDLYFNQDCDKLASIADSTLETFDLNKLKKTFSFKVPEYLTNINFSSDDKQIRGVNSDGNIYQFDITAIAPLKQYNIEIQRWKSPKTNGVRNKSNYKKTNLTNKKIPMTSPYYWLKNREKTYNSVIKPNWTESHPFYWLSDDSRLNDGERELNLANLYMRDRRLSKAFEFLKRAISIENTKIRAKERMHILEQIIEVNIQKDS